MHARLAPRLRLPLAATLAWCLLAAPATALTGSPAGAAGGASGCAPEAVQRVWNEGYVRGVEDIKAQLAQATARMQQQVQDQLNAQLAQLQKQRDGDLQTRLRAAQEAALQRAVTTPMPPALTGNLPAPAQSREVAQPDAEAPGSQVPARQVDLPPGSSLVIANAEALPPELFAALMDYLKR